MLAFSAILVYIVMENTTSDFPLREPGEECSE